MKIMKVANSVSYTAIVSQESVANNQVSPWQELVSRSDIPYDWTIHAHHMTLNMGACKDLSLLGNIVTLNVVAIGQDERVMAVLVDGPVPTKNKHPHITIAVAPGQKPFFSNQLKEWIPITPFSLTGEIREVGFQKEIIPLEEPEELQDFPIS
jgi:hypothetical protein